MNPRNYIRGLVRWLVGSSVRNAFIKKHEIAKRNCASAFGFILFFRYFHFTSAPIEFSFTAFQLGTNIRKLDSDLLAFENHWLSESDNGYFLLLFQRCIHATHFSSSVDKFLLMLKKMRK